MYLSALATANNTAANDDNKDSQQDNKVPVSRLNMCSTHKNAPENCGNREEETHVSRSVDVPDCDIYKGHSLRRPVHYAAWFSECATCPRVEYQSNPGVFGIDELNPASLPDLVSDDVTKL